MSYIKFNNCRRSLFTIPYVQGPKILSLSRCVRRDVRMVKFRNNCVYNRSDQDGINVLFGYRFGWRNKVCLSWKYSNVSKNIDLFASYLIDGIYSEQFLMSMDLEKAYIVTFQMNYDKGNIDITCQTALDRGYRMHTTIRTGGMGLDKLFFTWCLTWGLGPSMGNIVTKPEGIMELKVDRI